MLPEGVVRRQRLLLKHIQGGAADMPAVARRQQVALHELAATADVDDRRTARQLGEGPGIEDTIRVRRQRQPADPDVGARPEGVENARTVEAGDAGDGLRGEDSGGGGEAERREEKRRGGKGW